MDGSSSVSAARERLELGADVWAGAVRPHMAVPWRGA